MYINERIKNIVRIKEYEDRRAYLRLDMNENPEGLPEDFVREVRKKIDGEMLASYPNKKGLLERIARAESLKKDQISLTNGSDEAIRLIFEMFTRPGSGVVMVTPSFEMYRIYGEMYGVKMESVSFDETFRMPAAYLAEHITEKTDLLVLFNPNSPVGGAYTKAELELLLERCRVTETLVVIDEAYYPFGVSSAAAFLKDYRNLIVLRTFSKLYSMAGLRVGYALGDEELIRCMENAQATYNINTVGLLFAEELLKRPELISQLQQSEEAGRKYLLEGLAGAGYETYGDCGNYVLIRTKGDPHQTAAKLKARQVLVKTYKSGILEDWIRVTTGSRKVMELFLKELLESDGR